MSPRTMGPKQVSEIDLATRILAARRGCSPDAALALLMDAAQGHGMDVNDLAECLIADQGLRWRPRISPG